MNLTKILIRLLLIISVVGGGIYVAQQKNLLKEPAIINDFEEKKQELQGAVKGVSDNISQQAQKLTQRGQEVSKHVGNVLGTYIQPADNKSQSDSSQNSSSTNQSTTNNSAVSDPQKNSSGENNSVKTNQETKPIYEETFDYGRYLYCQQVIKDYEKNHSAN
ncbi:hypothetical protein KJ707_00470 [Patescibacteria group bacterium]|nr:hypothetical protein [Patescibacteria group bacterium]